MKIELEPIGYVRSPEKHSRNGSFEHVAAEIVLKPELAEAVEGLDEFSHLEVIYFMHIPDGRTGWKSKVHPRGHKELPSVGLFATRSPHRPNRIGLTLCELLAIDGSLLRVRGLDALDGSPVLDIKGPSRTQYSGGLQMRFPHWTETLARLARR